MTVQFRRQAGLDADLGGPEVPGLLRPSRDLFERQKVGALSTEVPTEGAEIAALDAYVGKVDVPINHIGNDLSRLTSSHLVGCHDQRAQFRSLRPGKPQSPLNGELSLLKRFLQQMCDVQLNLRQRLTQPLMARARLVSNYAVHR